MNILKTDVQHLKRISRGSDEAQLQNLPEIFQKYCIDLQRMSAGKLEIILGLDKNVKIDTASQGQGMQAVFY